MRVKERHWHICLYHPEKSAVSEYSINLGQLILQHNTSILAKKSLNIIGGIQKWIDIDQKITLYTHFHLYYYYCPLLSC
jgi:hypothetical protein